MNRIRNQYQTSDKLNTRISIHEKYSTNPKSFGEWIMDHYQLKPGFRILELGCGTGSMWSGWLDRVPLNTLLLLTDFSEGMLETAKVNTADLPNTQYEVVDIQDIPYPDASFDMVIANMMLYHVPDLHRGLSEVRRVLKPGGSFYCATYGEHGIMEFINDCLNELGICGEIGKTFTLQNGLEILLRYFDHVCTDIREDALRVTCVEDFVDYTMSLTSLSGIPETSRNDVRNAFQKRVRNGILYVPKEYGMFICK